MTLHFPRRALLGLTAVAALVAGCSDADPLATSAPSAPADTGSAASSTITVGSAGFPEAEIIAELYAQVLEAADVTVERNMQIGAREAYIAALEDGSVDLLPEYTGNLLQFWDPAATAETPEDVLAALREAAPDGVRIPDPSAAENKDTYVVTKEFSKDNNVMSLADLSALGTLRIAGNPELAERPFGPAGLAKIYGVPEAAMEFTPIDDGGGPLTIQALTDGDVDMANIYSTTPAITDEALVMLEDPENMIVPQQVFPLVSDTVPEELDERLNAVSDALTTEDLIEMNARNQGDEKASPKTIAADWLKDKGLV